MRRHKSRPAEEEMTMCDARDGRRRERESEREKRERERAGGEVLRAVKGW